MKKKDPEPEPDQAEASIETAAATSTSTSAITSSATSKGTTQAHGQSSNSNGGGTNWDDSEEAKEAEEKLAFAERVKTASEKEAARPLKTLEYEKRMASSYPEFRWDDPLNLVGSLYLIL